MSASNRCWSREVLNPRCRHVEHRRVQEDQGTQGLLVARCAQPALGHEAFEELLDRLGAELSRVARLVKRDKAPCPGDVGPFGPRAVVPDAQFAPQSLEESGLRGACCGSPGVFHERFIGTQAATVAWFDEARRVLARQTQRAGFRVPTAPRRLRRADFAAQTSPRRLHRAGFTAQASPRRLHRAGFTAQASPRRLHRGGFTARGSS